MVLIRIRVWIPGARSDVRAVNALPVAQPGPCGFQTVARSARSSLLVRFSVPSAEASYEGMDADFGRAFV